MPLKDLASSWVESDGLGLPWTRHDVQVVAVWMFQQICVSLPGAADVCFKDRGTREYIQQDIKEQSGSKISSINVIVEPKFRKSRRCGRRKGRGSCGIFLAKRYQQNMFDKAAG